MLLGDDSLVRISASIGIAVYPEEAGDMESLCIAADRKMYEEKMKRSAESNPQKQPAAKPLTA
jgi:GGDEF domain-containing protein